MTVVAFTGTREGMTPAQKRVVRRLLRKIKPDRVHQGCCVGADEDFALIARDLFPGSQIIGHPSPYVKLTSVPALNRSNILRPRTPPLVRNRRMVDLAKVLVACPKEPEGEELRSGTWATVRYARKKRRPIYIVRPDGRVETENVEE